MYTTSESDHNEKLQFIVSAIKTDPILFKNCWNDEMVNYFKSFQTSILNGEFEELPDVHMFSQISTDVHGLPLYIRLRGTVRTENLHKK